MQIILKKEDKLVSDITETFLDIIVINDVQSICAVW